eukprot:TRINITY_DN5430_c0_g1_i1.p1 TRINITY_DN5430_c0_g1~~TRINITY_DN5430_c0_g1_i1.p1  ORF type:complete len:559 (-),score=140.15 TRINITY_DN5430_c0_g1_i1:21-1697(-)
MAMADKRKAFFVFILMIMIIGGFSYTIVFFLSPPLQQIVGVADYQNFNVLVSFRDGGKVKGLAMGEGGAKFLGVPYVKAPVGKLRFAPPENFERDVDAIYDGTVLRPGCPQPPENDYFDYTSDDYDEDCLYMNIYVPNEVKRGAVKAVVVFLHPGSFEMGSNRQPLFNAEKVAIALDVIVVVPNYRLGVLGNMALQTFELEHGALGNFGLMDQQKALQWVHHNIDSFGGDNKRITLMGYEAGAQSVYTHLFSQDSKNHFTGAIIQSRVGEMTYTREEAILASKDILVTLCGDLQYTTPMNCLRSLPFDTFQDERFIKSFNDSFRPVIDSKFVSEHPMDSIKYHKHNSDVTIMIGGTSSEASYWLEKRTGGNKFSFQDGLEALEYIFGKEDTQDILTSYNLVEIEGIDYDYLSDFSNIITDAFSTCPDRALAQAFSDTGNDVYLYRFDKEPGFVEDKRLGAYYGADLSYFFGKNCNIYHCDEEEEDFTKEDELFMQLYRNYVGDFIKHQDPNENVGPGVMWSKFGENGNTLVLKDSPLSVHNLRKVECSVWQDFVENRL